VTVQPRVTDLAVLPLPALYAHLRASAGGLTSGEARRRLAEVGWNEPAGHRRDAALAELLGLLANPLVVILVLASRVPAALGDAVNAHHHRRHGRGQRRPERLPVMKYLLMGTSSNFGNMFSMAAAVLFLPFLPMLPRQILLNNFLYDVAQVTIPTDRGDDRASRAPQRWNIAGVRNFMLVVGPISSLYDFLTFAVLLWLFQASEPLFQTGWFVESLATQTLVLFVIRTAGNPLRSRPSPALATVLVVLVGVVLPSLVVVELVKRRLIGRLIGSP
jgi:magnesium-transporting ATPase (P-type)